jgi:hypothetical protein
MATLGKSSFLIAALCAASCGTTGGKLINVGFRAGGLSRAAGGPLTFATAQGWTVTLQTARIALGPFYFNVEPPPTSAFRGGTVILEATEQVIVDPLDPALKDVPGGADGETGDSLVVEIDLFAPDSHASAKDRQLLGKNIAYVAGTASKGSVTVPFAGPIAINTTLVTPQTPLVALERVNGASAALSFGAGTQAVEMRVDPGPWFDGVDFAALLGGAPVAGVYSWSAGNCDGNNAAEFDSARCTFQNELVSGVQQKSGVYRFAVAP